MLGYLARTIACKVNCGMDDGVNRNSCVNSHSSWEEQLQFVISTVSKLTRLQLTIATDTQFLEVYLQVHMIMYSGCSTMS